MSIARFLVVFLWWLVAGTANPALAQALQVQATPKSITVVLDDNYPPYIFRNAQGQMDGILKDTWAAWESNTGVAVRLMPMDWAAAQVTMQAGRADVIDTIFKTPARELLYDFSKPYATLNVPIFFHNSVSGIVNADSIKGFTVGVKEGDACIEVLEKKGVDSFKRFPSYSAVVTAAGKGDFRVFCVDEPPGVYLLQQLGLSKDFKHSEPLSKGEFHRAVHKGDAAMLALVESGFTSITATQYRQIDEKWYGSSVHVVSNQNLARKMRYGATAVFVLAVVLLLWNLTLRRRVAQKTRVLSEALAQLGRAKEASEVALAQTKTMLENDMVGIVKLANRVVVWANPAFAHMFGYRPDELVGKSTRMFYASEDACEELASVAYTCMATGQSYRSQTEFVHRNGERLWMDLSGAFLVSQAGESLWVFLDITERRAVDDRLRQLSLTVEQAPIAIVITDLDGHIEYANPSFAKISGYDPRDVIGANPRILQSGQTPPAIYVEMWATLTAGGVWQGELHNRKKNGDLFIEHAVIAPVLDTAGKPTHYVALKVDVTQRQQADQALQASLREKVALLNEVHHRVKNNLQVITSLLRLEAGRSAQPDTKGVLKEMQGRIYAMALLHESLYREGTFAQVNLATYLQQLATQVMRSQSGNGGAVVLVLELNPVDVSLDMATPCGLLANELISNSLKHGFTEGRSGNIVVQLSPTDTAAEPLVPQQWRFTVRDTGVGLPPDFEARRKQSLGLQLASDLARQMGGALDIGPGPGAVFSVTFPVK